MMCRFYLYNGAGNQVRRVCYICRVMKLQIIGNNAIRLLIQCYHLQSVLERGSGIGINDFAFKKRHTYGMIIDDQETHEPVAILDERDGMNSNLKEFSCFASGLEKDLFAVENAVANPLSNDFSECTN